MSEELIAQEQQPSPGRDAKGLFLPGSNTVHRPKGAKNKLSTMVQEAILAELERTGEAGNPLIILRTQDIVVQIIRNGALTIEAADAICDDWANNHRFKLKIASFADLL